MKGLRKENGSLSLEAAMVMPFYLMFSLALIAFVQIAITSMALQAAASHSVEEIAVHMYAGELLLHQFQDTEAGQTIDSIVQKVLDTRNKVIGAEQLVDKLANIVPEPLIKPILVLKHAEQTARQQTEDWAEEAAQRTLAEALMPVVRLYADTQRLQPPLLQITHIDVPTDHEDRANLTIDLRYRMKLRIPFFSKEIALHASASERAWIGNRGVRTVASSNLVRIESITPNPVYRGGMITLKAKVRPGAKTSITVTYKSGNSVAKGLEPRTADEQGYVSWTWKVGGSTTAMKESGLAIVQSEGVKSGKAFDVFRKK